METVKLAGDEAHLFNFGAAFGSRPFFFGSCGCGGVASIRFTILSRHSAVRSGFSVMVKTAPLYEPPVAADVAQLRKDILHGVDQEMFGHVGHFVSWFGAVDMILGMTLHYYSGSIRPPEFDVLTRGLDAKTKLHRLDQAMALAEWKMEPGLKKRLDHFQKTHIPLRNKLVHSYLYWPENGDLQICGVGNPPIFADVRFEAADPFQIPGLTLFERGTWLSQLCHDITEVFNALERPMPRGGVLGAGNYLSGLPSGATPGIPK